MRAGRYSAFAVVLLAAVPAADAREARTGIETAMRSVVAVLPDWPAGKRRNEEPEGSGVVILDGNHVLTAAHVLGEARTVRIATLEGEVMAAKIVARDPASDLALLSIPQSLPALAFGSDASVGAPACAIGNAFGLGLSVTCGTVSAVNRSGAGFNAVEDFVQTDAAVNPGASGGALIDSEGVLIGILSAIFTKQSDANIGVNFAVSAPLAARIANALMQDGKVSYPEAGMRLEQALAAGETGLRGARVAGLAAGSAAQRAGLSVGDIIHWAGERRIAAPEDFVAVLARLSPPITLKLKIMRGGVERQVPLLIGN